MGGKTLNLEMWPLISDEDGKGWKMLYIMGGKTLNLEMWPLISDEDGKGWCYI